MFLGLDTRVFVLISGQGQIIPHRLQVSWQVSARWSFREQSCDVTACRHLSLSSKQVPAPVQVQENNNKINNLFFLSFFSFVNFVYFSLSCAVFIQFSCCYSKHRQACNRNLLCPLPRLSTPMSIEQIAWGSFHNFVSEIPEIGTTLWSQLTAALQLKFVEKLTSAVQVRFVAGRHGFHE